MATGNKTQTNTKEQIQSLTHHLERNDNYAMLITSEIKKEKADSNYELLLDIIRI